MKEKNKTKKLEEITKKVIGGTRNFKEKIIGIISQIDKIRKTKITRKTKNLNELARRDQNKITHWLVAGLVAFIFIGWYFMHSRGGSEKSDNKTKQESVQMDGVVDAQFDQESSKKALDEQQQEIKSLNEKLALIGNQMDFLQMGIERKNQDDTNEHKRVLRELQVKIVELETALKRSSGWLPNNSGLGARSETAPRGITTTNFKFSSYNDIQQVTLTTKSLNGTTLGSNSESNIIKTIKAKTAKDYVPSGTFAKAVLLSGADTNAGVHGQTDTTPIVLRILDNGTLPNGKKSSLKGCFVTAAAYGDASSERGQIRLQRLSCIRKPSNHILDIPVEGTINDMGGNDGIRGHVVMRNNRLIWNAGVSGFLSGIGSAMQQSSATKTISPLGITSSVKSGKVFEHSTYGGANTALGKLADYYIKLADMYHPIVQVRAGSQVNIVFLKGFFLTEGLPEQTTSEKDTKTETTYSREFGKSDFTETMKNTHLGQPIIEHNNTHPIL